MPAFQTTARLREKYLLSNQPSHFPHQHASALFPAPRSFLQRRSGHQRPHTSSRPRTAADAADRLFPQAGVLHITPGPILSSGALIFVGPATYSPPDHSQLPRQAHRSVNSPKPRQKVCGAASTVTTATWHSQGIHRNTGHFHSMPAPWQQMYFCAGTDPTHRALRRVAGNAGAATPVAEQPCEEGGQGESGACSHVSQLHKKMSETIL